MRSVIDFLSKVLAKRCGLPEAGSESALLTIATAPLEQKKLFCYRTAIMEGPSMKHYTAVVERDSETGLYVGYVPGFPGAHSQGETLDELNRNLREVLGMLLEDGEPTLGTEFVGIQSMITAYSLGSCKRSHTTRRGALEASAPHSKNY